jgi:hypothetical protein
MFVALSLRRTLIVLSVVAVLIAMVSTAHADAPPNDDFANATAIMTVPFNDARDVSQAAAALDDPFCAAGQGATVWYAFTPMGGSDFLASTLGSNYNTILGVYTGTSGDLTEVVPCNDDAQGTRQSYLHFSAQAGVTYYLMVGGLLESYPGGPGMNLVFSVTPVAPRPANDDMNSATLIQALPFTEALNTFTATTAGDDPYCGGRGATVWYAFTPIQKTRIEATVSSSNASVFPTLSVYFGSQGQLTSLACAEGPFFGVGPLGIELTPGQTYYFMVGSYNDAPGGDLTLRIDATPVDPVNDDFDQVQTIPALPFVDTRDVSRATPASDDPTSCRVGSATIWYAFTPSADVRVTADMLRSSNLIANVAVYTGTRGSLSEVVCSFGTSVRFAATAGTTYYIQVAINTMAIPLFQLDVTATPLNDDVADAASIPSLPYTDTRAVRGATAENDPPYAYGQTVWYVFTPTANTRVAANTQGSDYDTTLAAYASTPDGLFVVANNDNVAGTPQSRVVFDASAGTTYYFVVGTGFSAIAENLVFAVAEVQPPANDELDHATVIGRLPFHTTQDTSNATRADTDPNCAGSAATVWYTFTPARDMRLRANTFGSNYMTALAVLDNVTVPPLEPIACRFDFEGTEVIFDAKAGTTYYFMIGSRDGVGGNLSFLLERAPPPLAIGLKVNRASINSNGVVTLYGTVTCSRPVTVSVQGTLKQQRGSSESNGSFHADVACERRTDWSATVSTGDRFRPGIANVEGSANAFDNELGESASAWDAARLLLIPTKR